MDDVKSTNMAHLLRMPPLEVLQALIGAGRVQIGVRTDAGIHERLGEVEVVTDTPEGIHCSGVEHDSLLDPGRVAEMVYFTSEGAHGRVLPKIVFRDAAGGLLLNVVGLAGAGPLQDRFADALGEACAVPEKPPRPTATTGESDPALVPLDRLQQAGAPVEVTMTKSGVRSRWSGVIGEVRRGGNFINLIEPGFHLHLRAGSVSGWRREEAGETVALFAVCGDGMEPGLALRFDRAVLEGAA